MIKRTLGHVVRARAWYRKLRDRAKVYGL